jgi:hypothetical protein
MMMDLLANVSRRKMTTSRLGRFIIAGLLLNALTERMSTTQKHIINSVAKTVSLHISTLCDSLYSAILFV